MVKSIVPHAKELVLDDLNNFTNTWNRFFDNLQRRIGGAREYSLGGLLSSNTTLVGNVGAGEDDLITYTLQQNVMQNTGDRLDVVAFGTTASNGNNKNIKLKIGTTTLFSTGSVAFNNDDWRLNCSIIRTGASTQEISTTFNGDTGLVVNTCDNVVGSEDFTTSLVIKCTGEATSNNDIVHRGLSINYYPVG